MISIDDSDSKLSDTFELCMVEELIRLGLCVFELTIEDAEKFRIAVAIVKSAACSPEREICGCLRLRRRIP